MPKVNTLFVGESVSHKAVAGKDWVGLLLPKGTPLLAVESVPLKAVAGRNWVELVVPKCNPLLAGRPRRLGSPKDI